MFSNAQMIGRLTRDPELRHTKNDVPVTNFSVAVNREFKNDEVDYFDITCWQKLAELVAGHKKKGDQVFIQGKMRQDRFKGDDGSNRSKVYVVADTVVFLSSKGESAGENGTTPAVADNDDIPF